MPFARVLTCSWIVALVVAGGVIAAEKIPPQPVTGKINWVFSYDEAKSLAKETGKPLFVVFRCER